MWTVPPPEDDYPRTIERVIVAVLDQGVGAGAAELEPIAYTRREIAKRPGLSRTLQAEIYRRDRFCCRYCGGELIPAPIMELLGDLYPDSFPFHPNWKGGQTHPAVLSRSPVVDHVAPGGRGADWLSRENLVTACWPCNGRKADFTLEQLEWALRPIPDTTWDGLTHYYAALWRAAGKPKPTYHVSWLLALGCDPDSGGGGGQPDNIERGRSGR